MSTDAAPSRAAASRVYWWLAAEPLAGDDVAWALTRVDDGAPPTGPADAGLLTGLSEIRALAESARPGEDLDQHWRGPLTDRAQERDLAARLGAALLPALLRKALLGVDPDCPDTVTIAVRGWLARVPWDGLALDDNDTRLVETARVLGGLAATLHVGRSRLPDEGAADPPVRVVDPGPSMIGDNQPGQAVRRLLYPDGTPAGWRALLGPGERISPRRAGTGLSVEDFSELLRHGRPARLTYFGHAEAGTEEAPAAAALIFTDDAGDAQPLSAFDWLAAPERFPAPPRVALIGCGSDDSSVAEQSGLPIASINSGASLVTATRWVLPLDPDPDIRPTTELALAVDRAHGSAHPVDTLRDWQLERLRHWRADGALIDTPLLWSSLVSYVAPGRPS